MNGDFLKSLRETFDLKYDNPGEVSSLILAYIGDAVYDVITRTIVISKGNRPVNIINKENKSYVNAETQARLSEVLEDKLTEEESAQFKRGRNAKSHSSAKNASLRDYRKATGFEAVIGYLFLSGKDDRILELLKLGFDEIGKG
ncbi:MAG: ribonuclease III [Lachnospiraceae bacterium]|nr:ribonuclease III [Lachnospiraceae bacterium]